MEEFIAIISSVEPISKYEFLNILLSLYLLVAAMAFLYLLHLYGKKIKKLEDESKNFSGGLRGKLELLETELNQLKTDFIRSQKLGEISQPEEKPEKKIEEEVREEPGKEAEEAKDLIQSTDQLATEKKTELAAEVPENVVSEEQSAVSAEPLPLDQKLTKTKQGFFGKIKELLGSKSKLSDDDIESLEEILISSDLGVKTSLDLIESCKSYAEEQGGEIDFNKLIKYCQKEITTYLKTNGENESPLSINANGLTVILVIGVNGVGKTTSVAKLASQFKDSGKSVVMAAADTFRAAAVAQLEEWGNRLSVPVVKAEEGAKPATVVYTAIDRALEENADILIIDTAGRLHNKANLMQELEGINNVISKKLDRVADETILVVDGAAGQNSLQQAKDFNSLVPLTGLIVTKLDGTPKGGIVIAIKSELGIPVKYIGVGEKADDLRKFNAEEFAEAILA